MKRKNKVCKNNEKNIWILRIIVISFVISVVFSFISEIAIPNVNIYIGIFITLLFIIIGVIFDMIGMSVTASNESVFHSMAAKKIKGAKLAVKFKKNADKVSSFCQDVIGDICGIVSGSTGTVISIKITEILKIDGLIVTLVVMGIISALTIGGKALEKSIAIKKSDDILYKFSYIMSYFIKER